MFCGRDLGSCNVVYRRIQVQFVVRNYSNLIATDDPILDWLEMDNIHFVQTEHHIFLPELYMLILLPSTYGEHTQFVLLV